MHAAVGPDDPKTKAIERNLDNPGGDKPTPASPQAISRSRSAEAAKPHLSRARAPPRRRG